MPRKFIIGLTKPGDLVLDPMVGSGTIILETHLHKRQGLGFDIDPLAILISKAKVMSLSRERVNHISRQVVERAYKNLLKPDELMSHFIKHWDDRSRRFIDYWFAKQTQLELLALLIEIEKISDITIKTFVELIFSAIIITKSGGVSMAFDLAHTRPHRAKMVLTRDGEIILGHEYANSSSERVKLLTKTLRSPLDDFEKQVRKNLRGLNALQKGESQTYIGYSDAKHLPLPASSVDLIFTSPPYASNAIDYMRAHKFSLVWLGYPIGKLSNKRRKYIGGESVTGVDFEDLPEKPTNVVREILNLDQKKGRVLHRYYSEMTKVLREMYRVLRPGKAAILIVGNSVMRGKDSRTANCLAEIGCELGFEVPKIGIRNLDRNRRMLPASASPDHGSQIENRLHEEYVIGFFKPKELEAY